MYEWDEFYKAVILETDRSKLPERVRTALTAINRRVRELNEGHGSAHESYAIREALNVLSVLSIISNDTEQPTQQQQNEFAD
jgi:hypothetical protein